MVQTVYWGSSDYMINSSESATITQAKNNTSIIKAMEHIKKGLQSPWPTVSLA